LDRVAVLNEEKARKVRRTALILTDRVRSLGPELLSGQAEQAVGAVSSLGWMTVPAIVVDAEPNEDLLRGLIENIARRARRHPGVHQIIAGRPAWGTSTATGNYWQ
jgi:hypothetical protein